MLVYGDPEFTITVGELRQRLLWLYAQLEQAPSDDHARSILILAGQIEQGFSIDRMTERAADVFIGRVHHKRAADEERSRRLSSNSRRLITIKVPEGYSFYALYPEQYVAAAERWLAQHAGQRISRVIVIGILSIGSSLSAVVKSRIAAEGRSVERIIVRPHGHPFDRQVDLPPFIDLGSAQAIIVDEGPGLSGSSMASVVKALERIGLPRERITLMPGHGGEPGNQASDEIREIWATTPRIVVDPADLQWQGRSLMETLRNRSAALGGQSCSPEQIECIDMAGGMWREQVCGEDRDNWPPAFLPFEAPKYLCRLPDGRAILWKFAGLADAGDPAGNQVTAAIDRQEKLAGDGFASAAIDSTLGFVASWWVEGRPLALGDASPTVFQHIARYIEAVKQSPLPTPEFWRARDRLAEMLKVNSNEALGDEAGERAKLLSERVKPLMLALTNLPAYGDGRLAPHEWIISKDGRILKTDCWGHDRDHTYVGPQTIWWDIAGAVVEWGIDNATALDFAGTVLPDIDASSSDVLRFYCAAYAAFWVGMSTFCGSMQLDLNEKRRMDLTRDRYARYLNNWLQK